MNCQQTQSEVLECQFWCVAIARVRRCLHTLFPPKAWSIFTQKKHCCDIKFLGYSKVTLKSDQEPSIVALANAVKNSLSGKGIQCQIENSPKGDAHGMSNGEAELAVSLTQGLARTLKDQVEQNTGQGIDPKSPVLGRLIGYAGVLYTLFSYDESLRDGLTPFRKLKGRDWTVALPPFGELVDYIGFVPNTSLNLGGTKESFLVFV